MNLKEKQILVVGGTSGIGKAVAELAFGYGAKVVLTGRNGENAFKVAKTIGPSVEGAQLDIVNDLEIEAFFKGIDSLDHIYIAAGSTKLGPVTEGELEENMKAFDTRILGSLRVVRAAIEKMKDSGSIIFTGGVSTDRPIKGAWVSGLATSTAEQMARVLVMEFPHVRFNAVAPGYTDTPMWDHILGEDKEKVLKNVAASLPVKKIASSEEVASAVIFLMSNASVTGEIIHVDGGGRLV
ncbi:SDR family oxidoreductase [Flagellimonas allohymeniacidonis]|uniref:SDR family oxidoreductase n=1 Tax=Flagellimonas allohymeniacidonis TaxID=2517819 RepID=A0A4Q8QJU1_9FLAO|nr:SDR family oxidoreductase [Allomuricauda hymeniacidonis]TAI48506.1 SDR family oxidoreductase [Allomuricauda hymeniacidonis]